MKKDFTKISFHSKLFKGRSNWYFCYLKSERLAHVLAVLAARSVSESAGALKDTAVFASHINEEVMYAAAGELPEEALLASLFSIMSRLRLQATQGHLSRETSRVLIEEYETLVEKLVGESRHLGLTISPQDLGVPAIAEDPLFAPLPSSLGVSSTSVTKKDIYKGQEVNKTEKDTQGSKGQNRTLAILELVRKSNGLSIKDISAVIRDCSEKTIQRELNVLIGQGVIVREGERRWSTYKSV